MTTAPYTSLVNYRPGSDAIWPGNLRTENHGPLHPCPDGVDHFEGNAEVLNSAGSGSAMMAEKAAQHGVYVCGGVIERSRHGPLYNTIAAYGT